MTLPIRVRTMVRIAERLAMIEAGTVIHSDPDAVVEYTTSPSLVTRSPLWITQYDQPLAPPAMATQLDAGPVLGVVRSSGSSIEQVLNPSPSRPILDSYEHQQRVTVWGYAKATAETLAGDLIEMLWEDHVKGLLADPRLGGLAVMDITPDGPLDTDDGALEPLAFFAQDWLVRA